MGFQDMFGMWHDTQDQANQANYTATNTGFNAAPASGAQTAHSLTNSGTGIAGNILTPEQAAAIQNGSYSSFSPASGTPGAIQGGYGGGSGGYGGGGGYGQSSSSGSMSMTGQNPYLSQMGDALVGQMTNNFNRNVIPRIGSQVAASGGYGGSRQGVIEANAVNDLNTGIGNSLASLYGQGYNTALNYDLGLRGNELGYANLDRSINNDNLNWQMQGANFGLGVYDRMQQANNLGLGAGSQIQNTPMNYWQNFSNQANSIGQGYGTQTSQTGGNPFMGALGGAQLGSQAANWWSSQSGSNNAQPYNPATAGAMAASLNANGYWTG